MAKKRSANIDSRKLLIAAVILLAFAAGFLFARARYKPQLKQTFNMVMEREDLINNLRGEIKEYEQKIRMEEQMKREF